MHIPLHTAFFRTCIMFLSVEVSFPRGCWAWSFSLFIYPKKKCLLTGSRQTSLHCPTEFFKLFSGQTMFLFQWCVTSWFMHRASSWLVRVGQSSGFSDADVCPWGAAILSSFNSGHWTYRKNINCQNKRWWQENLGDKRSLRTHS